MHVWLIEITVVCRFRWLVGVLWVEGEVGLVKFWWACSFEGAEVVTAKGIPC